MNAWDDERTLVELGFNVPEWIEQDITPSTLAAIEQGGCASGAYMPAVTYHTARKVMGEHGDEVLGFIEDTTGERYRAGSIASWGSLCCDALSMATELWALGALEAYWTQHGEDE